MIATPDTRLPLTEHQALAKKPNYDFEKRKKEQDRKKKKDAKREERLLRKRSDGEPDTETGEGDAPGADRGLTAGE
jgi:hypothetical protein